MTGRQPAYASNLQAAAGCPAPQVIPILLYHSVDDSPPGWIAPFTVRPADFAHHLDVIIGAGCQALTISDLVDRLATGSTLPAQPVVVTFDDGFADTADRAAPALASRGLQATVYITTGALLGRPTRRHQLPPAHMLRWDQLGDLEASGLEIGAHTEMHRVLDVLPQAVALKEIQSSKSELEEALAHSVRTFAYPHGYYDKRVAALVQQAGFDSACAVKNTLSSTADDRFALARLTVMASTSPERVGQWVAGRAAPVSSAHRTLHTRAWRQYRRLAALYASRRRP